MTVNGTGDATLNFNIVTYPSEESLLSSKPTGIGNKDNVLGIITNIPVSGWHVSAVEPINFKQGTVWIMTSTNNYSTFKLLKDQDVYIHPESVSQYIDGVWQGLAAKMYSNNQWHDFWNGQLYNEGNEYSGITGGWLLTQGHSSYRLASEYSFKDENCLRYHIVGSTSAAFITEKPIDISKFSTLNINCLNGSNGTSPRIGLMNTKFSNDFYTNMPYYKSLVNSGTVSLDVSAVQGKYYVCVADYSSGSTVYIVNIPKIWLE